MKIILLSALVIMISGGSHASYEDHFPSYFEFCSGTQFKLQDGTEGGKGGHAFTYIHGLCKDYSVDYPMVVPCHHLTEDQKQKYPHAGVGISLDSNYRNAAWVAIPGRDLTLFGDQRRKILDNSEMYSAVKKVTELKVFEGVIYDLGRTSAYPDNSPESLEEIAWDAMGTDFAINWARELHCVKIPVPQSALFRAARFLNQFNLRYKFRKDFEWDMISNNCTHISRNTSAAMGLNSPLQIDQRIPKQLFNLAVPTNAFMHYVDEAVVGRPSFNEIISSDTFLDYGFYPKQVGSLMAKYPAYPSNERFNTDELNVLTLPRLGAVTKLLSTPEKYSEKYSSAENTNLSENAKRWQKIYQDLWEGLSEKQKEKPIGRYLKAQHETTLRILEAEMSP